MDNYWLEEYYQEKNFERNTKIAAWGLVALIAGAVIVMIK